MANFWSRPRSTVPVISLNDCSHYGFLLFSLMSASSLSYLSLLLLYTRAAFAGYFPLREYAGATFYDRWEFTDSIDDKTWGNTTFLSRAAANASSLISFNSAGNVILKVDDTTTIAPGELVHRNTVRIVSEDAYPVGSVIIADMVHMPYGCSVWPSFWLLGDGPEWPESGEIDIVEGINITHTSDCLTVSGTDNNGCITEETKANSYGAGGVFMWFWSRPDVPKSISESTSSSSIDLTDWGLPSAAYPATSCNVTQYFQPRKMIMDITLCGLWAGVPSLYASTCPGNCVADNIIGDGSNYKDAYF
ncbi:GH16 domain-containing protein [Mycena kentingensis (nom. inval.)]|nr:GH16 domain-containing protein [Mycena kentingensis (nom. inval.)]